MGPDARSAARQVGAPPDTADRVTPIPAAPVDEFGECVATRHRELARFAYALCGDAFAAEDIVAEACARVWPRWRRGQVDDLWPYLRRAVAHEAFGRHRRARVARREQQRRTVSPPDGRFDGHVAERDALWAALGHLPADQRVVVVLRVVEDLSEARTAEMLSVPAGTVKSRLARGLAALRTAIEASDD